VKGLEDSAANVRESAVANIPDIWALCSSRPDVLQAFDSGIRQFASSPVSRRRMTFVACQQILVSSLDRGGHALSPLDDATLQTLRTLIHDGIEGVRIGVARFVALVYRNLLRHAKPVPSALLELLLQLSRDTSSEVRSFAARASLEESAKKPDTPPPENRRGKERLEQISLFSRPPISGTSEANVTFEETLVPIGRTMNETDSHFLELNGCQGNMDMDTSYDTATTSPALSSSGIYRGPSSASSSYAYDLGVVVGTASEQVQVPV